MDDLGSVPALGRSPGEGNGNPLQYSCLENPMDVGLWRAIIHRSQTIYVLWTCFKSLHLLTYLVSSFNPQNNPISWPLLARFSMRTEKCGIENLGNLLGSVKTVQVFNMLGLWRGQWQTLDLYNRLTHCWVLCIISVATGMCYVGRWDRHQLWIPEDFHVEETWSRVLKEELASFPSA